MTSRPYPLLELLLELELLLDDAGAWHGDAVAVVRLRDGMTVELLGLALLELLDELELLELELLLDVGGAVHGGTISVRMLLLAGSTSWFCGVAPAFDWLDAPPGVTRMVLDAGGVGGGLLLDELELELLLELLDELELLEEPWLWHGWTATVCVTLERGISIRFEPGGIASLPDWVTAASEHGGTAIVTGLCCCGMMTARTPGFWSAWVTGSWLELDELELELLLLLPMHALSVVALAMHAMAPTTTRIGAELALVMSLLTRPRLSGPSPFDASCAPPALPAPRLLPAPAGAVTALTTLLPHASRPTDR